MEHRLIRQRSSTPTMAPSRRPGCTENVQWSVLAAGGQVSNAAVTRFHEVISRFPGYGGYPNNNRPLQPLNGRVVQLRRGRHQD
jgi:carbonic anhydrase